ncbi:hypothetical protein CC86DRAFT_399216 [Ophiobolus disseminans]|uniref:PKD/Chitinase domain-containing protein n=1 Tax=Ophiobolus disseminans TaxID=1469910 RepID=A0A6A6ZC12_9PLEO|nr:hypothetical protein CC86DRAFT_399216 [Ophiobolus disseminans]
MQLPNSRLSGPPLGEPQDGLFITSDCIDPDYHTPIIDNRSNESHPVPHFKLTGHFENTTIRFNFHYPLRDSSSESKWAGRFFQFMYPTQDDGADDTTIGFGLDSGAYVIQITGTQGYRAEAASAKFSRVVATQYYGLKDDDRIFGYIYGASGGSLQVIGAMENTIGVWDGGVPIVQAIPASIGITHTFRPLMGLVLQNKSREIEDAIRPGGSGDPYASLNNVQKDILREGVQLGLSGTTLEDFYYTVDRTMLAQMQQTFISVDPSYVEDFWTKEGYLGSELSPLGDLLRSAVSEFNGTVVNVERDDAGVPVAVTLSDIPGSKAFDLNWDDLGYRFTISAENGTNLGILAGRYNHTTLTARFDVPENQSNDATLYSRIQPNTNLHIMNKETIALHAWYRYQVPTLSEDRGYIGFDQFRTANGSSVYPQRTYWAKALAQGAAGGANHSGLITGKMIVIQSLLDQHSLSWWAHWYKLQVQQSLGESFDDNYRLWYNDHAAHEYTQPANTALLVGFESMYQQALRDLSQWVEFGVAPPATSNYTLTADNDIILPVEAHRRGGIQPTVELSFSNSSTSHIAAGEEVSFTAVTSTPPGNGKIVALEWDFRGRGDFVMEEVVEPTDAVTLQASFTYEQPGEYLVVVRVTSQTEGGAEALYARIQNLGRIRVHVDSSD